VISREKTVIWVTTVVVVVLIAAAITPAMMRTAVRRDLPSNNPCENVSMEGVTERRTVADTKEGHVVDTVCRFPNGSRLHIRIATEWD
jgi:hypothetical protein